MFDDDFGGGGGFSNYQPAPVYYAPPEPTYYEPPYEPPAPVYEAPEPYPEPHDDPLAYVPPVAGQGVIFDPTSAGAGHGFAALALADAEATRLANDELNAQIAQNMQAIPQFEDTPVRFAVPRYSDAPTPAYTSASYVSASVHAQARTPVPRVSRPAAIRAVCLAQVPVAIRDRDDGWFEPLNSEYGWLTADHFEVMRRAEIMYLREMCSRHFDHSDRMLEMAGIDGRMARIMREFGYRGNPKPYDLWIDATRDELSRFDAVKLEKYIQTRIDCYRYFDECLPFDR